MDKEAAAKKLGAALRYNYFYTTREWQYKNIKPRIIAERYLENKADDELRDYKFYCFNGEPKMLNIISERAGKSLKSDYFDMDFNHLDITHKKYANASAPLRKPVTFDQMVQYARTLSKGYPHVRIDFFEADGKLYFGEYTFCSYGGFMPFIPDKWDYTVGEWLTLPEKGLRS
jgi:hypothetical protein